MKKLFTPIVLFFCVNVLAQNVGIGETAPTAMKLQVKAFDSAVALIQNGTTLGNNVKTGLFFKTGFNYSGSIATIGSGATFRMGLFTYGGSSPTSLIERISISDGGNVGIGKTFPLEKLDVNGDLRADTILPVAIRMTPNAGDGKVLTSDASGNATWQEKKINFSVKGDYTCGTCNGSAPYFSSMVRNAYVELPHLRDTIKKSGSYLVILTATGQGVDEYNALYDATDNRSDYEGYLRVCPPGSAGNLALIHKDIFYTKYSNPSNTTVTFEYHTDDGEKSAIVFLNAGDIIKTFGYVTQFIGPNAPVQVSGWGARAQVKFILLN